MQFFADNWIILLLILAYLILCLTVGRYFKIRASQGVSEFYIAKREIPGWVISLAFFSSFASTNTYIGQAGQAFSSGLCWAWVGFIWTVFCIISWLALGPRMRNQTASLNSVTIPDYFDFRYQSSLSRSIRTLSALVILFATVWYMAGIAKGCAHLLTYVLELPHLWGAFLIIFITCAYTVWGGMYSVLWTDAIQGIMMFGVAILMVALPFIFVGGVSELMSNIANTTHTDSTGAPLGKGLVTFCSLVSFAYVLGIGLAVGMKQVSEPRCLIRFYSIDNAKGMRFAMIWTPVFLGISLVCVMGLGALVHGMANEEEAAYLIRNTDEVVGFMLAKFDNQLISGISLAALMAAGMSSLAAVTLIVGTAFVSDLWNVYRPMSKGKIVGRTKATMVFYCCIVFLVTIFPPAGVVELTAFSGAIFAASFFPSIFGGLYLKWGTGHGAFWSMLSGMVSCIVWRFAVRFEFELLNDVHEIIPSVLLASLVYFLVSKRTASNLPDEKHLNRLFRP
jgi:SSS family transporter